MALIARRSWPSNLGDRGNDCTMIRPRSRRDRVMTFLPFDEDNVAARDCTFDEDRTLHLRPRVGR